MYNSLLFLIAGLITPAIVFAQSHALVRLNQPVVDVIMLNNGTVRMFTQDLAVWDANPSTKLWSRVQTTVNVSPSDYKVRRISQFTQIGDVLIGAGHIILNSGSVGISSVLRSTDDGKSFKIIAIGTDTLASADVVRRTDDGALFFLDRVGRVWKSIDTGLTWTNVKLPTQIPIGGARELDMIKSTMGVCIDLQRNIHFTTNGWSSVIKPLPSKRPIERTQPTLLEYFNWNRRLVMTNSMLYLVEGRDVFRTPTNDLLWDRWDTVNTFNASDDRNTLAWTDVKGRLWLETVGSNQPKFLDADVLPPSLIRVYAGTVITYREDTGPIVYSGGVSTRIPPRNADQKFIRPYMTVVGKTREWGIDAIDHRSLMFDLMYRDVKSAQWIYDTTLTLGPVYEMKLISADSLVFGTPSGKTVYNTRGRRCAEYPVRHPLSTFLSSPISRFRVLVAADELDSTHVTWCEYTLRGDMFVGGEIVDSSRFGVQSQITNILIPSSEVTVLIKNVDARGDGLLRSDEIIVTPEDVASFRKMLDTIFVYDAYFDVLDLYRPPPAPETQIEKCRILFNEIAGTAQSASPELITQAILAWRHSPKDEFSRYEIEFENRSGKYAMFRVERSDNAHPPLMLPWTGQYLDWKWHSWERGLTNLFLRAMPKEAIPPMFIDMARTPWYLAAVASYVDGNEYGRRHVWSAGTITPNARK